MNRSDERLSSALRELAEGSRQGASPELGTTLKDAFRRHHIRRRRVRAARIVVIAICFVMLAAVPLLRKAVLKNTSQETAAVHTIPPQEVTYPTDFSSNVARAAARKNSPHPNSSRPGDAFVALPSFDVVPAGDELRVVRLEMPGDDLRLVGAPVVEGIAGRRVTADFVVGHDGTPYAVRLVRTNF
ncbi:MAG TPA: hypothetical protein VJA94_14665 [Candidatus Angelobacter sp.]